MKKKICFPIFNRVHSARQKLLLRELGRYFDVHITLYGEKEMDMSSIAVDITTKFQNALNEIKPDLALIRGDRFELLPAAMLCAYRMIPTIQIEAGDLSGVIDNKVRYAISYLADYHFVTNDDSALRMTSMGFKNIWNYGALDCEFALNVKPNKTIQEPYILALYHKVPNEDENDLYKALEGFKESYKIIGVKGNKDYGKSQYTEEYTPEDFINLLRYAECIVGNSSCLIKEASVLGTPAVLVGDRQANRYLTKNIVKCPCYVKEIKNAINFQLKHGIYDKDETYYKPLCSRNISYVIGNLADSLSKL